MDIFGFSELINSSCSHYVVETISRTIFGDPEEIFEMLGANSDGYIGIITCRKNKSHN
jgi:hypothetical protein